LELKASGSVQPDAGAFSRGCDLRGSADNLHTILFIVSDNIKELSIKSICICRGLKWTVRFNLSRTDLCLLTGSNWTVVKFMLDQCSITVQSNGDLVLSSSKTGPCGLMNWTVIRAGPWTGQWPGPNFYNFFSIIRFLNN
jgi:hypothetical protein